MKPFLLFILFLFAPSFLFAQFFLKTPNGQFIKIGGKLLTGSVPSVTSPTGRIWMDRNLGASRIATSSTDAAAYGDYYQWGRGADGHQIKTSQTTAILSSTDVPGHANFIKIYSGKNDWRSPQNDALWQGLSGVNNPCPSGFRIPTQTELNDEALTWGSNPADGAFASPLKLTLTGYRFYADGSFSLVGSWGYYWTSTTNGQNSQNLFFNSSGYSMLTNPRAIGFSVRCIKD